MVLMNLIIMFSDEPTSALDQKVLVSFLLFLKGETRPVLSSHDLRWRQPIIW